MLRTTIITAAALAALASPAFARTVTLNLVGKSPEAVKAEVAKAAAYVCRDVSISLVFPDARSRCVSDTIKQTNAKIAAARASAPAATLASR